jgi:hypothetical protein
MDAAPPPPPVIIVQRAADHQPLILLGFTAVGPEANLSKLGARAEAEGLAARRATNDRNEPELMVLFRPGSPRTAALALYRETLAGKLGPLRVEVVILPAPPGATRASLQDASIEPPSYITPPDR